MNIVLVQETFLKPNRPKACKLANYTQILIDSSKSWYCCVLQKKILLLSDRHPTATKFRSLGMQIGMTMHCTLIIVSVYLPPKKRLLRSDIETLLALGDAVILFGDLNSKNTD
ncbi:hypothetical protein EVAR_19224_1 [Eumeta japonica]|uniref:RNA-directed DNA polymerase from mobile element jockey n=1 Tax=Eumeta variegata TaxID=151549 RepID=A0A4C1VH77_EUMVA|nr:hypothetical protein EVAR_19224_1 [Eumeta japonica]